MRQLAMEFDIDTFDAKKARRNVKIIMPILAIIVILIFIVLPIWTYNKAVEKESIEKGKKIEKYIHIDLF